MADDVELTAHDALDEMVGRSGMTRADVSRALGHDSRYISRILNKGTTPSTALLARIAKACGYRLQLVGHGSVIDVTDE